MDEVTTDMPTNNYDSETFTLSAEEEVELLESIAEIERGEWLKLEEILESLPDY